jgi:hypothetical protein
MQYSYAVELWMDPRDSAPTELVTTRVRAQDRYEAVALARRYVERQHPQIDLARIDTWFVPRRLDPLG